VREPSSLRPPPSSLLPPYLLPPYLRYFHVLLYAYLRRVYPRVEFMQQASIGLVPFT
jgi:hypothetical protein